MKIFEGQKGKHLSEPEYLTYTHKKCPRCETIKAVTLFYRKTTQTARGWAWDSACIECRRSACREYGKKSRSKRNKRLQRWRRQNPLAAAKVDRRKHLRLKYGITPEDYNAMRAKQNAACAICNKKTERLFVDHCHTTGKVRALLCQTCNTFLGWYEKKADTILKFQNYLSEHS